ncbi:MAG: hypothetical protein ACX94B_10735 [Henriciella sp.]
MPMFASVEDRDDGYGAKEQRFYDSVVLPRFRKNNENRLARYALIMLDSVAVLAR